jgi:hypothetical protein
MVRLLYIAVAALLSCSTAKKNTTMELSEENGKIVTVKDSVPACIRAKIDSFKKMAVHEQPRQVTEYVYKDKKVYYVTMPCCDFFNEVYDVNCNLLGHPDGGFTGKGDGKLPNFTAEKSKEKIIWLAVNK